jgi:hypothetical protein
MGVGQSLAPVTFAGASRLLSSSAFHSGHLSLSLRMGKPLPDSIYKVVSQSQYGLKLRRGPDPWYGLHLVSLIGTK